MLQRPEAGPGLLLTWVITARHRERDITRALAVLGGSARPHAARGPPGGARAPPDDSPLVVIDSHCHAGKGDGLIGPWDTDASLGHYARRAAAAGITRTVLYPAFNSDYARANRILARIVSAGAPRYLGFAGVHPEADRGRVAHGWCGTRWRWDCAESRPTATMPG